MSSVWHDFWERRHTYVQDPKTGKVSTVMPELFYVGTEASGGAPGGLVGRTQGLPAAPVK